MRNCFIPGCDQFCRNTPLEKRKMFYAPKDKRFFDAWMAVIPKKRTFKPHDKVCERHFNEEDINTTYDNVINGKIYKLERGRAKLHPEAIPSRNLDCEKYCSRRKHKQNTLLEASNKPKGKVLKEEVKQVEVITEITLEECSNVTLTENLLTEPPEVVPSVEEHLEVVDSQIQEQFDNLYDNIYEVILPNTLWGIHRCPERSFIFFSYIDPSTLRSTKTIAINSECQVKIIFANRLISEQGNLIEIDSISDMISEVDATKLCPTLLDNEMCEVALKDNLEICESCKQIESN